MKVTTFIFVLFATICAIFAYVPPKYVPPLQRHPFPTFPGHGPFNPKIKWPFRLRPGREV
ncbi:abaecin-like [Frieseomelitta varia]|uniref:abaecin-like n=1 Tax=Frieseomelitta varia TaxID=561572 RepID=UPI001CB67D01|nr:abaecin-like [Frieseomelitta varia]